MAALAAWTRMHRLLFVGITTLLGTDASQQRAGQTKAVEWLLRSTAYYGLLYVSVSIRDIFVFLSYHERASVSQMSARDR